MYSTKRSINIVEYLLLKVPTVRHSYHLPSLPSQGISSLDSDVNSARVTSAAARWGHVTSHKGRTYTARTGRERRDDARANERARENGKRRRIYIVQIYSRLGFGSLPILFSQAKAASHCARANFVTDYRALLVCVGGGARSPIPFRSRCRGNTREEASFAIDPFTRSATALPLISLQ